MYKTIFSCLVGIGHANDSTWNPFSISVTEHTFGQSQLRLILLLHELLSERSAQTGWRQLCSR